MTTEIYKICNEFKYLYLLHRNYIHIYYNQIHNNKI